MLKRAMVLSCLVVGLAHVRGQEAAEPAEEPPPLPKGIEVMARGPVHEAFASPTTEPTPTKAISKRPPKPLDELPPEEKPEGQVVWIGGYWAWDEERSDFLWVSGVWRTPPPHKQWIAGYWRELGDAWQWVAGFWTDSTPTQDTKEVAYLPNPPEPPQTAAPSQAPANDSFYVPGCWIWNGGASTYAWRAGYWARVQPGYVWVADHYRWTPSGYIFIPGYWDLALSRRGVLYAPVVVDPVVVTAGFCYTPVYAVSDTVIVDALFVRPAYAHYYFGDYYGPAYATMGFQSAFVYGGGRYDSLVVYETWAHRSQPNWLSVQINVFNGRNSGRLPVPPRTLVQQNNIIQQNITNVTNVTNMTNNITNNTTNINQTTTTYNKTVLAPASKMLASQGVKTVPLNEATRVQAKQQAAAVQQVAAQRSAVEKPLPPGSPRQAHVASLSVPQTQAVRPGFVAPRVTPQAASNAQAARPLRPAATPTAGGSASPFHPGASVAPRGQIPSGPHPTAAHAPPGQPMRTMPGYAPRPTGRPAEPTRRPPPKEHKEHP